jgi:CRISPR-associated protein Csd2
MDSRYDFVYLFDVKDGNPNGDPDAGNLPRIDPETGQGLVTDVCLKRKIRNYVGVVKQERPPYEIYVKEKAVLNQQHERAYEALKLDPKKRPSKGSSKAEEDRQLTEWMCKNFFDIRAFGAVMTTEVNCGQVRGPIQFGIGRSVEPIVSLEHAVTRCAVTNERDLEKERTIGRKFSVPYGLYRVHGFINPYLAAQTTFNENSEDLELFWTALLQMFETDRSASRGEMAPQTLVVFEHESPLGNAPANKLFERVRVGRTNGDQFALSNGSSNSEWKPARSFANFSITVNDSHLPSGIKVHRKL